MDQLRINLHESIPLESGRAALKIKAYDWHMTLAVKTIKKKKKKKKRKKISFLYKEIPDVLLSRK